MAPTIPAGAQATGPLPRGTTISALVALRPRDPAALAAFVQAVSSPGSPEYRHYLPRGAFASEFGPTSAQIDQVEASLRAAGLNPGPVSSNGLLIPISATAEQLASAFAVSFERYRLPSGRTAFVNTAKPSVDSGIAGLVQRVIGLDTLAVAGPVGLARATRAATHLASSSPQVVTGGPQPCSAASSSGVRTADQIASAYGLSGLYGAGDLGSGQTVAIYELEGNFPSDIAAYKSCYSLSTPVSYETVDAGPPSPTPGKDGLETELDIEDVAGLAPNASIVVYQGPNGSPGIVDTYSRIISDDSAKVISSSWGLCEALAGNVTASENTLFQQAAAQGQSIVIASGDAGSEDCHGTGGSSALAVDDPASQPRATGVGGTTMSAIGPPPAESVWNNKSGAGGGGISTLWQMPSYQSGAPSSLHVINGSSSGAPCGLGSGSTSDCREVPDVSADADPSTGYAVYYSGWTAVGGTSAAAPTWAALTALGNASSTCAGKAIGELNPKLYAAAANGYASDFHDVTAGNNDFTGTNGGRFPAGTGYDMASGLGTPNGTAVAHALCSSGNVATGAVTVANPGNQTSTVNSAITPLQMSATDTAGGTLSWSGSGLPTGLTISPFTGKITGTPSAQGTFNIEVTATDSTGPSGSAFFRWTIGAGSGGTVTVTNPGNQTGTVGTAASLQMQANDTAGGTLTWSESALPSGLTIDPLTGKITGAASAQGTFHVEVTATDSTGASGSVFFAWTIGAGSGGTVTVTNPGSQTGTVGTAVGLQMSGSASDGGSLTWSESALPTGLSMDALTGKITGVPSAQGTFTVEVTATDSTGPSASVFFKWTINGAGGATVTVANPGNQTGTVGAAVGLQLAGSASDGGTLTWSASGLPAGLSIDAPTGKITGTPSSAGTYNVTVTAKDSTGPSGSASFSWTISAPGCAPYCRAVRASFTRAFAF